MKVLVMPTGTMELVERGLAKIFTEDDRGVVRETGEYKNALLPGASKGHRVFWDDKARKYDIDLTDSELNAIVEEMALSDENGKMITTANRRNEFDAFFKHDALELDVPNTGITLDTDTAHGKYWLAAFRTEPKKFNIDNNTDNPLVKNMQEFRVITEGFDSKEVSKSVKEGMKATGLFEGIKNDFKKMLNVCRAMNIIVSDNPNIEGLRSAIYLKITTEKDFKTADGVRNIEHFIQILDMPKDDLELQAKITEAIGRKIIKKEGRKFIFEEEIVGTTPGRVFAFFQKNTDLKAILLAHLDEKIVVTQ